MDASNSNLTDPRYGYDFVVSTTQASVNSGLLEYLWESNHPVNYVCYLSDPNTGNATTQISLDELLKRTNGVNPFDILDGTPANDPRVEALTRNKFAVGVKIRIGVPPGVMLKDLPPILELGRSNGKSLFRMFCSEFQVIQNTPSGESSANASWNVWNQSPGTPWHIETAVDIVTGGLDRNLETPYFNQHPDLRRSLQFKLNSLSTNTSFSLQQTLLDLENATYHSVPNFLEIPAGSHVLEVLQKSFVDLYSKAAKSYGEPILAVTAVAQDNGDPSQLQMTSSKVGISRYKDSNACVVNDPNPEQAAVATLNHLCMTDGNGGPEFSDPYWNWVQPWEVRNESGVIAIKRAVFAEQLKKTILPSAMNSCITPKIEIKFTDFWGDWKPELQFFSNQKPQKNDIRPPEHGAWIIDITWSAEHEPGIKVSNSEHGFFDTLEIVPHYTCEVSTWDSTIKIQQRLWINMSVKCEGIYQSLTGYDITITDFYDLSVDQTGRLNIVRDANKYQREDKSQEPNANMLANMFSGVNDAVNQIKSKIQDLASIHLQSINFATPQNFVFPGSKVFTYASAKFSNHQDLICNITYTAPTEPLQTPPQVEVPTTNPSPEKPLKVTDGRPAPKPPGAAGPPSYSMTHTTDLIQNYIQGEIVSPTEKFVALQTNNGNSLLFALSNDNVLNVIMEESGKFKTGWVRVPLSAAFPSVRTFDVGQSVTDGSIGMALVVSDGGSDQLFLSLSNSSSDTSWTAKPNWSPIPFDAEGSTGPLRIVRVMFAEPKGSQQHIIVDISRSSNKAVKDIARYYVEPQKSSDRSWSSHSLPGDIEQENYQSCVGRVADSLVDGVYTLGTASGSAQLFYVPIENPFGNGPPLPCRLSLPQNTQASSIAAARRHGLLATPDGTTDLFAIGNSTLYYFAAERQTDMSVATQLLSSDVFSGTSELAAMTHEGVTTIWGKNASNQVYYLSCPSRQLDDLNAWSVPVPILFGVEKMTPYLNRSDGGKAIFTSGSGKLQRLTQATGTDAKMWIADEIRLQAESTAKPLAFKSYTTTIQVLDKYDLPAPGMKLSIATSSRTPVYMNGIYYVLGQTPITVTTDAGGSMTVVEALHESINGTLMTVICNEGGAAITINPMEKTFQRLATLNTEGALREAKVPTNTVAGGIRGNPSWEVLVKENVTQTEFIVVADSLSKLSTTYGLVNPTVSSGSRMSVIPQNLSTSSSPADNLAHNAAIAAGDLFRWLKSDVERAFDIIKDDASGAWHFVATIAGKGYRAALTTVEAIVGAAEWVFNAVKTSIKKVMSFVESLFDWDDIERTKDVICNMTRQWLRGQVEYVRTAKAEFDDQIAHAEKSIEKWAGITNWGSALGSKASQPAAASGTNPAKDHTSGSQMMMNHFKIHSGDTQVLGTPHKMDAASQIVDDLLDALEKEEQTISEVYNQLKDLAKGFSTMTVEQILKELIGIIAVGVLSSVQVVVDALLNVLIDVAGDAIGVLDTEIYIPVISDILKDIGIQHLSYLDVLCWIPAVSFTVVYKAANQKPPFAANDEDVQALASADSWETFQMLLVEVPEKLSSPAAASLARGAYAPVKISNVPEATGDTIMACDNQPNGNSRKVSVTSISSSEPTSGASTVPTTPGLVRRVVDLLPLEVRRTIYYMCHFIGASASDMGISVSFFEANELSPNKFQRWSGRIGIANGAALAVADFIFPKAPIQSSPFRYLGKLTSIASVLAKVYFGKQGQEIMRRRVANPLMNPLTPHDPRATGAMVDMILVIPAVLVTREHLYELCVGALEEPSEDRLAASAQVLVLYTTDLMLWRRTMAAFLVARNDSDEEGGSQEDAAFNISTLRALRQDHNNSLGIGETPQMLDQLKGLVTVKSINCNKVQEIMHSVGRW
ncbi:hypothetical protein EsH8_VII_000060 [Colletotrichum jinshuiense]